MYVYYTLRVEGQHTCNRSGRFENVILGLISFLEYIMPAHFAILGCQNYCRMIRNIPLDG